MKLSAHQKFVLELRAPLEPRTVGEQKRAGEPVLSKKMPWKLCSNRNSTSCFQKKIDPLPH